MKYFKFTQLTVLLWQKHIQHQQAAEALGISISSFNRKLDAVSPWTLDEMYKLTAMLNKTMEDWDEMFPNLYKEAKENG